jgi:hypothetical protein
VQYQYATAKGDYRDLASGFVLRSAPGQPAFPVRLAQELFQRSAAHLPTGSQLSLWDPCCGSGYLAAVLGLLYRRRLARVICSDISAEAVALAAGNLALLSGAGLAERERELRERAVRYGKPSYLEAAQAALRLAEQLRETGGDLPGITQRADIFDPAALATLPTADLVITDVPYGEQTAWQSSAQLGDQPLSAMLHSLCQVLPPHAIVAICARKRRISFGRPVQALERLKLGHRSAFVGRVAAIQASWQ